MDRIFYKIQNAKTDRQYEAIANEYRDTFKQILLTQSPEKLQNCDKVLLAVVRTGHEALIKVIAVEIIEYDGLIDWQHRADLVGAIVTLVKGGSDKARSGTRSKNYSDFFKSFVNALRASFLLESFSRKLFEIVEKSLKTADPKSPIHTASTWCASAIDWTSNLDLAAKATVLLVDFVKANPTLTSGCAFQTCVDVLESAYRSSARGLSLSDDEEATDGKDVGAKGSEPLSADSISSLSELYVYVLPYITDLFQFCCSQLPRAREKSLSYVCLASILDNFLSQGDLDPAVVEPMIPEVVRLRTCGKESLEAKAVSILAALCNTEPSLVADQLDSLLELYLAGKAADVGHSVTSIYEFAPEKIESRLDSVLDAMMRDESQLYLIPQVLTLVAKRSIDLIKDHHLKMAVDMYDDSTMCYYGTMFLEEVAATRLEYVSKYEATLVKVLTNNPNYFGLACNLLATLTSNETEATAYLKMLAELLATQYQVFTRKYIIDAMCSIGRSYPNELAVHRNQFETFRKQPDLRANCQEAINIIERLSGRRTSTVKTQIKDTNVPDIRLTTTADAGTSTMLREHDEQTIQLDQIYREPEESTAPLTEGLNETQESNKVPAEGIPVWLKAVSKLLNEYALHDWRSVAARLGFSNDDIRKWTSMPDPCLAMLQAWLASNTSSHATYAVYRVLLDVNRTDAAALVAQAFLHLSAACVDDDKPLEAQSVFLSYQWASLRQVKLLRRHLALAGYAAWMDVHEHVAPAVDRNGDKPYAKSDAAIRASEVVVCCVSELYAQSASCSREVTLAVSLGKPVVPLLLENITWPPFGPIGPIFNDQLAIRFFRSSSSDGKIFWRDDKFSELLMQLRYIHAPDQSIIPRDSPYRNWWLPAPDLPQAAANTNQTDKSRQIDRPATLAVGTKRGYDVFLSYQWDMQPYVRVLYGRLTQLGYSCWLDIMQMSGKQSLYEKIDSSLNSCAVVISCVSKKYALSVNCRLEISLADSLKKPIVPLLFEKLQWPPKGPIESLLAQLTYIDFSENVKLLTEQQSLKFDQLVQNIESYVAKERSLPSPVGLTRPRSTLAAQRPSSRKAIYSAKNSDPTLPKLPDSKRAAATDDAKARTPSATRLPQL